MSERMTSALVCNALIMALCGAAECPSASSSTPTGAASTAPRITQILIGKHELICSMSGKGNCWNYAVTGSFFHTLSVVAIHGERFSTREHMRQTVFEYIEVDCNPSCRDAACSYINPAAFEAQRVA